MVSVRRIGGLFVVGFFVVMMAVRPLVRNPAIAGVGIDGILRWPQILLYLPLFAVTGLLVGLAVLAVVRGEGVPTGRLAETDASGAKTDSHSGESEGFWAAERKKDGVWGGSESATEEGNRTRPEQYKDHPAVSSDPFEEDDELTEGIDHEVPDAQLSEHLDHHRTELSDDETVREDLDTLETVVEEAEAGHDIPARCPRDGCDAVWSGRTMLGIKTDRYAVVDDGEEIVCLDCESVYRPESRG